MAQEYESAESGLPNSEEQAPEALDTEREQSEESTTETEEQSQTGEESTVDNDPAKVQQSYKELQEEFRQRNEREKGLQTKHDDLTKSLDQYGGMEGIQKWEQFIQSNRPAIEKLIQSQQTMGATGLDLDNADDDTVKAVDLVNKLIDSKMNSQQQQMIKNQIQPIQDKLTAKLIDENVGTLENNPDFPKFDEMRDSMADVLEQNPGMFDETNIEHLKDLYWKAARETGKFDELMASAHQQKLEKKKSKSVDKPTGPAGKTGGKKAKTIREAYDMAVQETGLRFE